MAKAQRITGVAAEGSNRANAALIIPIRLDELIMWEEFTTDPQRVYELHQMRIAAKRLRYTLELFAPFYDAEFRKAIDEVKAIQETLGSIHDADVLVPDLQEHMRRSLERGKDTPMGVYGGDFEAAAGILQICRRKTKERMELFAKFNADWSELRKSGFFERLKELVKRI